MTLSFLCSALLIERAPLLEPFVCLPVLEFTAAVGVFTWAPVELCASLTKAIYMLYQNTAFQAAIYYISSLSTVVGVGSEWKSKRSSCFRCFSNSFIRRFREFPLNLHVLKMFGFFVAVILAP